jgi:putative membrane protein
MSGINVARGAAIGVVEAVPGVSGGTMALVVGIYERLIAQGGHLVGALRALLPGGARAAERPREHLSRLDWGLIVPVVIGMGLAVVVASRTLPDLIDAHPVGSRAVFFGMVAASVAVPLRITGMLRGVREWALLAVGFAVTFVVSGLPPAAGEGRPPYWLVGIAAAIAICALVLPGFSGSFLLLVFGLYEPTLRAVAEFDLAYIAVFGLGALIGLGSFVALLQWLLEHHRRTLMVVVAGVLLGALRALWPWQDDARGLLLPDPSGAAMLVPALLGAALVAGIMLLERRLDNGSDRLDDGSEAPTVALPIQHHPRGRA